MENETRIINLKVDGELFKRMTLDKIQRDFDTWEDYISFLFRGKNK